MGYYQRKAGEELFAGVLIIGVVCLIAIGPWMIGNAVAGAALGWVFELIYIALIVWLIIVQVRKSRVRAVAAAQRHADLIQHRVAMAATNTTWFDTAAGHYRHSTCTIRHRSAGAAQRCNGRI